MNKTFLTTRRQFLQVSMTSAGGLLIGLKLSGLGLSKASEGGGRIGYFVEIAPDNSITIHVPKPEIGQGVHTSLPMLLAEELDADFDAISVKQLPVRLVRREDGEGYRWLHGSQDVGGSTSIVDTFEFMRQAGSEARRRLIEAGAKRLKVRKSQLKTEMSFVFDTVSGKKLSYGDLVSEAAAIPESQTPPPLKDPSEFTLIGTSRKMKGVDRIVTGKAEFGIDAEIPGMLHAVVERAPKLGAKIQSIDDTAALAVPGVRHVVPVPGPEPLGDFTFSPIADGVAVVADSHWAALKGRDALSLTWSKGAMEGASSESIDRDVQAQMQKPGQVLIDNGNVQNALGQADRIFEAEYNVPLVSHATLEPQGCIAHVREDGCDIVVSTQDTSDTLFAAMKYTNLPLEKINVRATRVGGGFGRRLDEDYVPEAVIVSKAIQKPVHVLWTREDDMRNDFYRPFAKHKFRIGLNEDGTVSGWEHKLATPGRYFRRGVEAENIYIPEYWLDDFPAKVVPDLHVEYFFVETAIPTGPWRAPGHTANAFAVQSLIDELAHEAGQDPLDFRLKILGPPREIPYEQHGGPIFDTGRLANVLRIAAKNANWGETLGPGVGRGIAGHFTFGSYVAHVIDVRVDTNGNLKILKVTSAVDCGIPVNINGIKAQAEGSINDGLSTALGQEITLKDGAIVQGNFDSYEMMRIGQAPPVINVEVVRSAKPVKGMGEPAIPPVAPALTNAIFNATGKRIRNLPVGNQIRAQA